jgi:hypothetical protein
MCFPAEVASIQLPQDHTDIRKVSRSVKNDYRGPVNPVRTFRDMEPIQGAAARMLAASGVLDAKKLELGMASRTMAALPAGLLFVETAKLGATGNLATVNEYILRRLSTLPLGGVGGLKQRTGLMEHRYDVA